MFVPVEKVTVKIINGQSERDWALGILKRHYGERFDSTPQGEDEIVIQPKKGKELFFTQESGANGMVPIFRTEDEDENVGLEGYCEETGEKLIISLKEVVNA